MSSNSRCKIEDCCKTDLWESSWNPAQIKEGVGEELVELSKDLGSSLQAQCPLQAIPYLPDVPQDDPAS